MSRHPKSTRIWNKQEKRIVRLLYRKGFLSDISNLYWESYRTTGKKYKSKGSSCSFYVYLNEIHYCVRDYWGEYDEYPLVEGIIDKLILEGIHDSILENYGYNYFEAMKHSSFQYKGRKWFIKYLKGLPTVRCDSKINKVLKIVDN